MPVEVKGSILTFEKRARVVRQITRQVPLDRAQKIVNFARGRWPVKTGRSRATLRVEEPRPGTVLMICDATNEKGVEYGPLILSKGVRPWQEYIVEPGEQMVRELPALIGKALMDALKVR